MSCRACKPAFAFILYSSIRLIPSNLFFFFPTGLLYIWFNWKIGKWWSTKRLLYALMSVIYDIMMFINIWQDETWLIALYSWIFGFHILRHIRGIVWLQLKQLNKNWNHSIWSNRFFLLGYAVSELYPFYLFIKILSIGKWLNFNNSCTVFYIL